MSDKTPVPQEEHPHLDGNPADLAATVGSSPKSLATRLMALGFIVAVVAGECLAAYFFFPSASQTTALAGATAARETDGEASTKSPHRGGKEKHRQDSKNSKETPDQLEVDLGEYSVTAAHSAANATLQITFRLFGTVAAADEKEFQELKKENEHRFREQVLVTVRGANLSDLTEAGLGLLKRNILEKTNRVLGRPILQTIIFSDFVFIEQ